MRKIEKETSFNWLDWLVLRVVGSEYTFTTISEIEDRDFNFLLDMDQYITIKEDLVADMRDQEARIRAKQK